MSDVNTKKTLVVAKHAHGPHENGYDGCHGRIGDGLCPGVKHARWLNSLADDDVPYNSRYSCGDVRDNYLREGVAHVVPLDPALAALRAEQRRLRAALRVVGRRLKEITT